MSKGASARDGLCRHRHSAVPLEIAEGVNEWNVSHAGREITHFCYLDMICKCLFISATIVSTFLQG